MKPIIRGATVAPQARCGTYLYKYLKLAVATVDTILFNVEVIGDENLPEDGSFVIALNHPWIWEQFFPMIHLPVEQMVWVTKKELFRLPVVGRALRRLKFIPVDRSRGAENARVVRVAQRCLKEGLVVGIFPEGRLSESTEILCKFRGGVGGIAQGAGRPIVPVGITYFPRHDNWLTRRFLLFRMLSLRTPVRVSVGEPIYPSTPDGRYLTARQMTAIAEERVKELVKVDDGVHS